jgi:glycosyltransferase involved in cell wall biosynthesis
MQHSAFKHRVLYLSYDGMTDPLGQSQVIPYLKGLRALGHQITLVSFEKSERYESKREYIYRELQEAGISWIPLLYTKNPPVVSTVLDLLKLRRISKKLHLKNQFTLVHCRSYLTALVGLHLKRVYGLKFLFDMRGFWADERVEGGIWNLQNPLFRWIYRFFKKKEVLLLEKADHVISLTHRAKEEILSWQKLTNKPSITVIPCCVDLERFNPERVDGRTVNQLRATLTITEGSVVLGYVGSIGTWYMLPEMMDYFKAFRSYFPSAIFLFVSQENPETILRLAASKGIPASAIRIKACTHDEVPLYISLMHRSIFFIKPSYSKMASSPTKQGELMAMGIPIVCNAGVGDTDHIVKTYRSGFVLEHLNDKAYATQLSVPHSFDKLELINGANAYFSLKEGVRSYQAVYLSLAGVE